jgi:hypothetical protein
MRSEAVLLVLLAAPCVVESAAALPKDAVVKMDAVLKAMQQSKPVFAANKKGLLAFDSATCAKDWSALSDDTDYALDQANCNLVCATGASTSATNTEAGTDTTENCLADKACVDFKKTCASKAPSGWWVTSEIVTVIKDIGTIKGSTQKFAVAPNCFPSSCEGLDAGVYKIEKQDPVVTEMPYSSEYSKTTLTTTFEQMPAGFPIVIVIIVVAVLALGVTAYLVKTGKCCCGKGAAGEGAAADKPAGQVTA